MARSWADEEEGKRATEFTAPPRKLVHFDASLPTWSLGGCLILIRFGANDIAFGVDTKCPQLLEPVEDVLHEVINGASDRGITLLRVSALKGHIETVQLLLDWELLLLRFASIKLVVLKKPDGLYPVVSGASNVTKIGSLEVIKGELTLDGTTRVTRIKKEDNSCPSFAYPYNLRNRGDPSSVIE
ncbi:hypothetical protein IGI04_026269 [Brassica rapa subsp. trilocularis]|uniref:GDSL esterase/lipase n=1 Tax=Brassica rapa subsp. trilocularis TaxID=1813537 RepID=A0ABQ7KVI8_BRACM|nr:hypothetical protein IGI04_026269 [Brassica rapa subsp. trilocularis]